MITQQGILTDCWIIHRMSNLWIQDSPIIVTSDAAQTSLTKFKALEDTLNQINGFLRDMCKGITQVRHVNNLTTSQKTKNQNEIPTLKDDYTRHCRRYWISFLNLSFTNFDHEKLIANFLSELREIYWTKTEASCFVSDKVIHIFYLETKSGTNFSRIHQYSQKCPKLCRGPRDRGSSYFWKSI